jgi:hypothetical protein
METACLSSLAGKLHDAATLLVYISIDNVSRLQMNCIMNSFRNG